MRFMKLIYNKLNKKINLIFLHGGCLLLLLLLPASALSNGNSNEIKISDSLNQGLHHLLSLVGQETSAGEALNIQEIAPVLEFVASQKEENTMYFVDEKFGAPSAYYEFFFEKDLEHVLRFSFNPEIPSFFTTPSSVRLALWNGDDGREIPFSKILESLKNLNDPLVISGVETIENTPDLFTGGYYKYDLERTILLFKFEGRPVLISLSKQKDTSAVGKKGIVLGKDDDWSYLYSGITGLNKTGLGWVDSYMYDSYSIIVYYETNTENPSVKCGAFKWLRAGWKNINVVKKDHIYKGLQRFGSTYKEILESPSLPAAETIGAVCKKIFSLDMGALKNINRNYLKALKERYAAERSLSAKWIADLFEDDAYVESMDRHELQSVVLLEYLKRILGKHYDIDIEKL